MINDLNFHLGTDWGSGSIIDDKHSGNGARYVSSNIARLIHQLRIGRKMTRIEMSESLGISLNHLYLIELGYRFPSVNLTLKIAETFNMNPFWIKRLWLRDHLNIIEQKMNHKLGLN